jgi:ketosteroid isomerase-like protein
MRGLVLIVALAVATPLAAQAQADSTAVTAELVSLDRKWQEAVVTGDAEFIEKRTASSFRFTHGGGTRSDTKADWLRTARQVPRRFLERKASNQSVEVHGDVALVVGRLDVQSAGGPDAGLSCYALEYVHLYARENGQWMFLSHRTMQGLEAQHPCAAK